MILHLPLTISIHRGEVENIFLPNFALPSETVDNQVLLPLNITDIDWYLISAADPTMALHSPSQLNVFTTVNSTGSAASFVDRSMPLAKALPVALVLSSIVVLCICGNILVILSVFTFRPLRTVQNFFIVSLAFSDMFVAIMVMPFHIVVHILKRWIFGKIFCQIFVTCDVLLCTSSILNLCAIALDRYWAISDPIQYARQRTLRRVLLMIMFVWMLSATISVPPIIAAMLGSRELQNFNALQQCELSNNKAYVIYSACGSFYIPALIMTIVYAHVFLETRKRFRERAKAAAKLANATRKITINNNNNNNNQTSSSSSPPSATKKNNHKSLKYKNKHHHHHHHHHHRKHAIDRTPSNGSAVDNFSTDDADETINFKATPTSNQTSLFQCQIKDARTSQVGLPINTIDNNNVLPTTKQPSTVPLYNQFLTMENNRNENGCIVQQQHAAVQTTEMTNKTVRPPKDTGRRSLFKGKSLAALMNERQKISLTRERRLSRTLGIIIGVFLLCWLPFFVVYILSAFIDVSLYIIEPIPTLILWLGYLNSACNPLIYTVFNVEFRTAFKRLLCPRLMNPSWNRSYTNRQSRN